MTIFILIPLLCIFLVGVKYVQKLTFKNSLLLRELLKLNSQYATIHGWKKPFVRKYMRQLSTKNSYDNLNWNTFINEKINIEIPTFSLLAYHISKQRKMYFQYEMAYENLRHIANNLNFHKKKQDFVFYFLENYLYNKFKLPHPTFPMRLEYLASYTSPKGRNSYSKYKILYAEEFYQNFLINEEAVGKSQTESYRRQLERNKMTPKVRVAVLQRDNYKCRYCGRSARDGVTLHVDHIQPVSKNGKTEICNLQTLCADCNLGKSNIL